MERGAAASEGVVRCGFGLLLGLIIFSPPGAFAQDDTQPYIEKVKEGLEPAENQRSFIEKRRRELEDGPEGGYIESIRRSKEYREAAQEDQEGSFIERRKRELGDGGPGKSVVNAVKGGRDTELEADYGEPPSFAGGFRLNANRTAVITAPSDVSNRNFNEIYSTDDYTPDLTLFGEWQPFRNTWLGSLGLVGSVGVAVSTGTGTFEITNLSDPKTGDPFGSESKTEFQFFTMPVSLGVNYRFSLLQFIRPYVQAMPTVIAYWETRSDSKDGHRGTSQGAIFSGGAAILLDWISSDLAWDMYSGSGVKNTYLTIEYTRMITFAGDVDFDVSGIFAGFTFEY